MGKPSGLTKSGGRKKGTPNRKTAVLLDLFEKNHFDPVSIIIESIRDPSVTPLERAKLCVDLMAFVYPKRKAIETPEQQQNVSKETITYVACWGNDASA